MPCSSALALATAALGVACSDHGVRAFVGPGLRCFTLERIYWSCQDRSKLRRTSCKGFEGSSMRGSISEDCSGDQGHNVARRNDEQLLNRGQFASAFSALGTSVAFSLARRTYADDEVNPGNPDTTGVPVPVAQAQSAQASPKRPKILRDLGLEVPYTGKSLPLDRFLGSKATLVVNPKIDDPESLTQMPGITKLAAKYSKDGLNVLLFPTDQGYFEADEDRVVRIKIYQFYGFGQYPKDVVFDKIDIVGNTIHPLYRYLCTALKNPNGIARITLNYEKFLLDKDGVPVRRYPRKLEAMDFEDDVQAVIEGRALPAENRDYKLSWLKAGQEALKSEYAFKLGLNYYNNGPASTSAS